jgi:hypothetical protein
MGKERGESQQCYIVVPPQEEVNVEWDIVSVRDSGDRGVSGGTALDLFLLGPVWCCNGGFRRGTEGSQCALASRSPRWTLEPGNREAVWRGVDSITLTRGLWLPAATAKCGRRPGPGELSSSG